MQPRTVVPLAWRLGFSDGPGAFPRQWIPATVPGAVQADCAARDGLDLSRAEGVKQIEWAEDRHWWYVATISAEQLPSPGQRVFFVARGIDYRFDIRLDGGILHQQEGMFSPVEIDLTGLAREGSELTVLIFPIPKWSGAPANRPRAQANRCFKPAVSYGWDFHPRLVPIGIWDEAYLEVRPSSHLRDAELRYELAEDLSHASLTLHAAVVESARGQRIEWTLSDPAGNVVLRQSCAAGERVEDSAILANPKLWWPNGQGPQSLHTLTTTLLDAGDFATDTLTSRVGFRRVRLVMNPGAWDEPRDYPKSRSHPPITLEVNGRRIFAKGSNWVPPDMLFGRLNRDIYAEHLTLARDAHFNLLRVWGGGIVNKEAFFDLCDEMGLMVWQEFPLACNNYPDEPHYLSVLDVESKAIIRRVRRHPSLAIWCGGNELFNSWSGMTDQSRALRQLNANCLALDPATPFLPTSPVDGVAHGDYRFRDPHGREVFQIFAGASATAYCEFGCSGPVPAEVLRKIIRPDELFPPRPGTAWESHHAFRAWVEDSWLALPTIEHYFGPSESLEQLVERGQLLQAEGYRCLFEEARRQKPRSAMALNWCFNEPWPCAANNSLIAWPCIPKPAYEAVKSACRPTLASARVPKFTWSSGEEFTCQLFLLHDAPESLPAGRVEAFLRIAGHDIAIGAWDFPPAGANENIAGPELRYTLPDLPALTFALVLRVPDRAGLESQYILCRARP